MARIDIALFTLTLCLSQRCFAQIWITPLSLKDTNVAELYLQVENKFRITGLKDGDKVVLADKVAAKHDPDVYILLPAYPSERTLTVKNRNVVIYSKEFNVLKIPDPVVRLDTIQGTYATIAAILGNPKIVVETGNLKHWVSLLAFDLAVQTKDGYEQTPTMLGDRLSVYQTDFIKRLKPGDKLLFENIRASCPNCDIRTLKPFTVIIQ